MRLHRIPAGLVLVVCLVLAGCAAREQINHARAAWSANDPVAAARYYEAALDLKPKLTRDADFMAEVSAARRDAAVVQGQSLLDGRQWLPAIEAFESAIAIEAGYAPAVRGLAEAQQGAAAMFHAQAIQWADAGQLDAARDALQAVLEHRPDDARAQRTMALLDHPVKAAADAREPYRRAQAMIDESRWREAEQALEDAIEKETDLLVARAAKHRVRQALAETAEKLELGRELYDQKRLDESLAALEQAQARSPHDPDVAALLGDLQRQRAEVDRLLAASGEALATDRWDEAIELAQAAAVLHPDEARAAERVAEAQATAAAHHAEVARARLASGDLDDAEASLRRALGYQPEHPEARQMLAAVSTRLADEFASEGRWGAALLRYRVAEDLQDTPEASSGVDAARAQVVARNRVTVELRRADDEPVTAEAAVFEDRLLRELAARAPAVVEVRQVVPAAAEQGYSFAVAVVDVRLEETLASSRTRTHSYDEQRLMPNPELDRLDDQIERALRAVDQRHQDVVNQRRRYEHVNERARVDPDNTSRQREARRQYRLLSDVLDDLQREQRDLRRLERQRMRTPALVPTVVRLQWPYHVDTYQKQGRLVARVTVRDPDGTDMLPITIEAAVTRTDDSIRDANPAIGLFGDPIELPSDAAMGEALTNEAVRDAARELVKHLVLAEAAQAQAMAELSRRDGSAAAALEARVDAAVLLETVDKAAGRRAWRELANDPALR